MTRRAARTTTKKWAAVKTTRSGGINAKNRATATSMIAQAGTPGKRSTATRPAEKDTGAADYWGQYCLGDTHLRVCCGLGDGQAHFGSFAVAAHH